MYGNTRCRKENENYRKFKSYGKLERQGTVKREAVKMYLEN